MAQEKGGATLLSKCGSFLSLVLGVRGYVKDRGGRGHQGAKAWSGRGAQDRPRVHVHNI